MWRACNPRTRTPLEFRIIILLSALLLFMIFSTFSSRGNSKPGIQHGYEISLLKQKLGESETYYQDYIMKREAFLVPGLSNFTKGGKYPGPGPGKGDIYFTWEYFLPAFSCPYSLSRIGDLGEGGKWVCGFYELYDKNRKNKKRNFLSGSDPECIIYSFGISAEASFETEILKRTDDCKIYAYDGSLQGEWNIAKSSGNDKRLFYTKKVFISGKDTEEEDEATTRGIRNSTLGNLMRKNGHGGYIDFLKLDIGGDEFPVLNQILDEFKEDLPFSQLQVHFHVDKESKGKLLEMYQLWGKMEAKGLRAFRHEFDLALPILFKDLPLKADYSFINIKPRKGGRLLPFFT